ncbi:hypothetical protein SUGI_0079060 [Cryptomeria japonica]|nr:hypothetical protein SUGI_0079060 [Cryptomeria japonica]
MHGAMAQSDCNIALVSLSPCLNYISGNETTPSQGCCGALATVVKNNASCLCQLLTGNNQLGIAINQTRALAMPGECKVATRRLSANARAQGHQLLPLLPPVQALQLDRQLRDRIPVQTIRLPVV